jgi:tRNA1Val (adenine37-N6)-methyltransferase
MPSRHQNFLSSQPALEAELGVALMISGLTGPLRIFQRTNGHRYSIDDVMTAWYALQKCPLATHLLDLGAGIGTVGLVTLWGLSQEASLVSIEAQEVSYKLLRANISCNDLSSRVTAHHGDLRELNLTSRFPLITGSPPYFPKHAGIIPADPQKAHARFELRGDVGDYARVARRHLEPNGIFVFCFPFQQKARCLKLVSDAGLTIYTIRDVVPRQGRPPLFSLYSAGLATGHALVEEPPFVVADESGIYTEEMRQVQLSRGFGPDGTNLITESAETVE